MPSLPSLTTLLPALPLVGALSLIHARTVARATRLATLWALLTLGLSLLTLAPSARVSPEAPALCPLVALLVVATLVGGPRGLLDRELSMALLLTESAALGVVLARAPAVWLGCLVAVPVPLGLLLARRSPDGEGPPEARVLHLSMLVGALPLLALLGLDLSGDLDLSRLTHVSAPFGALGLASLAGVAVGVRMAVVPFHSWLPGVVTRMPMGMAFPLMNMLSGLVLWERLSPALGPGGLTVLGLLGVGTALHGAVLAWAQTDLRRMLAFVLSSHSGLLLAAMAWGGAGAARLQVIVLGLTFTGLGLLVQSLEGRAGTADMTKLGGLHAPAGRMSALFLLLALAGMGLPGTLGFTSEDQLLRTVFEARPASTLPLLLALALDAVTLLRAWQRTFLGPPSARPFADLLPRERWVAVGLVAVLLAGGLGLGPSALPPSLAPSIDARRAHRQLEDIRNRREHHVPVEATQRPGEPLRGAAAGPGRL